MSDDIRKAVEALGVGLVVIWLVFQCYDVSFLAAMLFAAFVVTWLVPTERESEESAFVARRFQ